MPGNKNKIIIFLFSSILFLGIGFFVQAENLGENANFNIDPSYDISGRTQLTASLIKIAPKLYLYIDKTWWDSQDSLKQNEILNILDSLSLEFENKIYPTLTRTFGSEWNPGIDGDSRITVLLQPMIKEAGGYFNSGDEYPRAQYPNSNQREMIYLNVEHLNSPILKSLLAHEFTHLITFNQKDKIQGVSEEIWLNEARSEYAPALLGYDDIYEGSNLQRRVRNFLDRPTDSLTEWQGKFYDYGVLNIFTRYLVDIYGVEILTDSLKMKKTGIESLNAVLSKKSYIEDFSQIFVNWTIAILMNDCSVGLKYCYRSPNLTNFRIMPTVNFLPFSDQSTLSVISETKQWAGSWQKFIGGKGNLKLEFSGSPEINFKVPYIVEDSEENYSISFLQLDQNQKGEISISDWGTENTALIIIPSAETKLSNFSNQEPSYQFSWQVSTQNQTAKENLELIKKLLAQIEELKKQIAEVQAKINAILASRGQVSCQKFENNLYYGMMENSEVRCLQEFLKIQGPEVYPEGLVTGNFLSLTQQALIRFQEKYASEILIPLGLQKGTGYVGPATRTKINQLLGF